ncbi:MAG TPA: hypothetical protein VEL73_07020, partial [Mycobacteriales bacterium]|nr:hypothetical protein [Mycobacteriales bacterium]
MIMAVFAAVPSLAAADDGGGVIVRPVDPGGGYDPPAVGVQVTDAGAGAGPVTPAGNPGRSGA